MVKYTEYKGKQVETKTEQAFYLMGSPVFDRSQIAIEDVPINENLKEAFKVLSTGDGEPYFFISEMKLGEEFPTAYGDIMTKEWAESFIKKLDTAPFPMSALGHTNVERPLERVESHGYVVGGKVQDNSMFLRNYLRAGSAPDSKEFVAKTIQEMRSGMLSTSISNLQKYVRLEDPDTNELKWYVVESVAGQRNDIVEHDLVGSEAAIIARSFKSGEKAEEKSATKNPQEEKSMDKKEMLKKLQVLKSGGDLSVKEIVDTFGLELVTDEQKKAVSSLKAISDELGEGDALANIKSLKEKAARTEEAEFEKVRNEALKEVFKTEEVLEYATELFALKSGDKDACVEEAKRIASLKTMKDMASKLAGDMSKNASFKKAPEGSASNDDVLEM